jgi:sugar lactone lactonase YvrE
LYRFLALLVVLLSAFPETSRGQHIYWTSQTHRNGRPTFGTVHRAGLDGQRPVDLVEGNWAGVAASRLLGGLYISDLTTGRIVHVSPQGEIIATVVNAPGNRPVPLVVSEDDEWLYWVDGLAGKVQRAASGSEVNDLFVANGPVTSGGLALHPSEETLFFSSFRGGDILRVPIDGTPATVIIPDLGKPTGLVIAPDSQRMYWVADDTTDVRRLQTVTFSGSGFREVALPGLSTFTALGFDHTRLKILWYDNTTGFLTRADLDGANVEPLAPISGVPWQIAVDRAGRYAYWGGVLDRRMERCDLETGEVVTLLGPVTPNPDRIAIDRVRGKIYWADTTLHPGHPSILRSDLDGTAVEKIVDTEASMALRFAIDSFGEQIYWTNLSDNTVMRSNLDGSNVTEILSNLNVWEISLDDATRKMYLAGANIWRANLDGTQLEEVVNKAGSPKGLTHDPVENKLYWIDWDNKSIRRANADGSQLETIVSDAGDTALSLTLDLAGRRMFWTDRDSSAVKRASLDGRKIEDALPATSAYGVTIDPCGFAVAFDRSRSNLFADCIAGPRASAAPECFCPDLSGDASVDLRDYAIFQRSVGGR